MTKRSSMHNTSLMLPLIAMHGILNIHDCFGMEDGGVKEKVETLRPSRVAPWRPPPLVLPSPKTPVDLITGSWEEKSYSPQVTHPHLPFEANQETGANPRLSCCVLAHCGTRHAMEDRHTIQPALCVANDLLCGVFDGHQGIVCRDQVCRASEVAAKAIPLALARLKNEVFSPTTPGVENLLCQTFLEADREIEKEDGGTTATVAYLWPDKLKNRYILSIANTGDSRTLICDLEGRILLETRDHKASDPEEEERIAQAGGIVLKKRLSGSLAISRSLGDHEQKTFRSTGNPTGLIPLPETCSLPVISTYVILQASDGLWDNEPSERAAETVATILTPLGNRQAQLEQASRALYQHACGQDEVPRDDVTILLTLIEPTEETTQPNI